MPAGNEIQKMLREQGQPLSKGANSSVVTSSNSEKEEITYSSGFNSAKIPVTHPYFGPNSWIRIMPERGTKCLIDRRAEDGEPFISSYIGENTAQSYIKSTEDEEFYYRSLREGEVDIASPGIANAFFSRRGTLELKGGATSLNLSHENLEISARAPTHTKAILGNKRQEVGDEERFGVVVRPGSQNIKFPGQPTIRNIVEKLPLFYAKEYLRIIRSDGPIAGVTLIEHREGDVYDDSGLPITSKNSGRNLRSQTKYGTEVPGITTDVEIDVDGNITVSLPPSAIKGLALNVLGPGNVEFTIGKDFLATVTKNVALQVLSNISMNGSQIDLTALVQTVVSGPVFNADTTTVSLATGADTPAVRGTDLVNWLLTHTHGTGVGPSGPPITPPPPAVLSTVVKLK